MKMVTFKKGTKFFNEGRFHDAHEAWECHWLHMEDSPEKRFLQGMIKVAAALDKYLKKLCRDREAPGKWDHTPQGEQISRNSNR